MSNSYDSKSTKKIYEKVRVVKHVKLLTVKGKEVALQKVANKMVAT